MEHITMFDRPYPADKQAEGLAIHQAIVEGHIETLRQHGVSCVRAYGRYCSICDEAATVLSTLQAENEKLRAELEQVKEERDAAVEYLRGQCRYCKRRLVCTSRKGPHSNCWEWRGQKKD